MTTNRLIWCNFLSLTFLLSIYSPVTMAEPGMNETIKWLQANKDHFKIRFKDRRKYASVNFSGCHMNIEFTSFVQMKNWNRFWDCNANVDLGKIQEINPSGNFDIKCDKYNHGKCVTNKSYGYSYGSNNKKWKTTKHTSLKLCSSNIRYEFDPEIYRAKFSKALSHMQKLCSKKTGKDLF